MAHTPWTGRADKKLYLQSGQFTSTLKTSEYIGSIDIIPSGIDWYEINTPWIGNEADKLYLQSGQFTSTLKTSEYIGSIDQYPYGISYDGVNTPWAGDDANKLYLQSGQFTSTVKTSQDISSIDLTITGISYDGANTPWIGSTSDKLYLQSGYFTSTLKTSQAVGGVDSDPKGISWDGTNTPWTGYSNRKLHLQSGQFTSTLKTSEDISGIDIQSQDISTNDYAARLGIEAIIDVLTFNQEVSKILIYALRAEHTPWCGAGDNKIYLQSGQFTSTLKTSEYIGSIDLTPHGIEWDGTNTPWCGNNANKLYLQSGQFTSTLKTSQYIGDIDTALRDISWDGINTPWAGSINHKLYLQSGQFTSTLKTSEYIGSIDQYPYGISYDGTNTPWVGIIEDKLYLQSGQFTSTVKTSQYIGDITIDPISISFDGTNTPWIDNAEEIAILYLQSGQFTSTVKTSEDISNIDFFPTGISTNNVISRIGWVLNTTNSLTLNQTIFKNVIHSQIIIGTLLLNDIIDLEKMQNFGVIDTLQFNQSAYFPLLICEDIAEWPRWIFASASKHFADIVKNSKYSFFIEGTHRDNKQQEYIEFRMDGPNITRLNRNYYKLEVEINILWSFIQDYVNYHEPERIKGLLITAMEDICVYRYGDGLHDDNTFFGILKLKQDKQSAIRVNNFGTVRPDVKLMQGTIEGSFEMFLTCQGK